MALPTNPVTMTPEQVADLNKHLSRMRHDVNNHLSLIVAATELMKFKPEMRERLAGTLSEQAPKIVKEIGEFSTAFDQAFGITRD